jgi:hypothetical protein
MMHDTVKIVNTGEVPWTDRYDSDVYLCSPGDTILAPSAAAKLWFGNWDAKNDARGNARVDEVNRLRTRYGAYHNDEIWDANRPKVEVYGSDGEPIPTVIADPHGTSITQASQTVDEVEQYRDALARMKVQMDDMQKEYRSLLSAKETAALEDIPVDAARPRKRRSPQVDETDEALGIPVG